MYDRLVQDYKNFKKLCLSSGDPSIPYDNDLIDNRENIIFYDIFYALKLHYPLNLTSSESNWLDHNQLAIFDPLSDSIYVDGDSDNDVKISSVFHEIAHFKMHNITKVEPYGIQNLSEEFEAETVQYLVCRHLNIINNNSKNYVMRYVESEVFFDKYQENIIETAYEIIQIIMEELN